MYGLGLIHTIGLSTSGISIRLSERGGHSITKVLLTSLVGSESPSKAHAMTTFPLLWRTEPISTKVPDARNPVSS
jgi:hypothetical protein